MDKKELRKYITSLKRAMTADDHHRQSRLLMEQLEQHTLFLQARCVLLYNSLPDEVDTKELISRWCDKKELLLPTVVGDDLELHTFNSTNTTRTGAFGIEESCGELFIDYSRIELVVVPGVAFDVSGNRLGRGKGYYDRLLHRLPNAYKLGLCFDFQLVDNIPSESHDIQMDEVITHKVNLPLFL